MMPAPIISGNAVTKRAVERLAVQFVVDRLSLSTGATAKGVDSQAETPASMRPNCWSICAWTVPPLGRNLPAADGIGQM
jgi:hypothetical protein